MLALSWHIPYAEFKYNLFMNNHFYFIILFFFFKSLAYMVYQRLAYI